MPTTLSRIISIHDLHGDIIVDPYWTKCLYSRDCALSKLSRNAILDPQYSTRTVPDSPEYCIRFAKNLATSDCSADIPIDIITDGTRYLVRGDGRHRICITAFLRDMGVRVDLPIRLISTDHIDIPHPDKIAIIHLA